MIEAGGGTKRIELDESAFAIDSSFTVISQGFCDYGSDGSANIHEIMDVVKFLQKYDCSTAMNTVIQFVKTHTEDLDGVVSRHPPLRCHVPEP